VTHAVVFEPRAAAGAAAAEPLCSVTFGDLPRFSAIITAWVKS
jgi:hypothetical protein